MLKRNPYEPETKEQKQVKADISKQIQVVAKLASECLDDPKFKKYKDEFEKMRSNIFAQLSQPIDPDPIKDAHYLRACINTLLILDQMLLKPRKDIR